MIKIICIIGGLLFIVGSVYLVYCICRMGDYYDRMRGYK